MTASRFEIIAFDNGGNDDSPMRARLEAAFDRFIDISPAFRMTQAADNIARAEIDILVNLNGYFGETRMGVFARRPAPIQVNYLGFPAHAGRGLYRLHHRRPVVIPEDEATFL